EAKKAAEAKAKEADRAALLAVGAGMKGVDGVAFANPLLPQTEAAMVKTEESAAEPADADRMPGSLEATEGSAPEIVTHASESLGIGEEPSPEEEAMHIPGVEEETDEDRNKDYADDE